MNRVRVKRDDGTVAEVLVKELSKQDLSWLDAVRRNPQSMKTDLVDREQSVEEEDTGESADADGIASNR